ncbi:MAG: tandem-95 repeat protein, partial [Magnetococcales bacterium]|nr:tandem-95 repeat protein [Magnetococcales bacterium]
DSAPSDILSVTLSDFHGHITLAHTSGIAFTLGGNGQSAMQIQGTMSDLNAALSSLVYQGQADWNGDDVLSVQVNDRAANGPLWSAGTVAIHVASMPDAPVAGMDALTTTMNTPLDIATGSDLLANDLNPDHGLLTLSAFSQGMHGQVVLNTDSTFTYVPGHNFAGLDRFSYTIEDASGHATTTIVSVVVNPVTDGLHTTADHVTTQQDQAIAIANPLANDSDSHYLTDGGHNPNLQIIGFSAAKNGTVLYNPDGTFTYRPNAGFTGRDTFTYTMSDGGNRATTGDIIIDVKPVSNAGGAMSLQAHDDTVATRENQSVTIANVLANDVDPNSTAQDGYNPAMKVGGFSAAQHGTVSYQADGSFLYQPNQGFSGSDQFSYLARTPDGRFGMATVHVVVDPAADATHADTTDHHTDATVVDPAIDKGNPINFNLSPDAFKGVLTPNSPVTYTASGMPKWLTFDPDSLSFSGVATRNDAGVYAIVVTATDSAGLSASGSFQLAVANSAPGMDSHHAAHNATQDGSQVPFVIKQSLMDVVLNRVQGQGEIHDGSAVVGKREGPSISISGTELLTSWRSDGGPSVHLSQNISGTQLIAVARQDTGSDPTLSSQGSGTRLITRVHQDTDASEKGPANPSFRTGDAAGSGSANETAMAASGAAAATSALPEGGESGPVGDDHDHRVAAAPVAGSLIDAVENAARPIDSDIASVAKDRTEAAWSGARKGQAIPDQDQLAHSVRVVGEQQAAHGHSNAARDAENGSHDNSQSRSVTQTLAATILRGRAGDEFDLRTIAGKERKAGTMSVRPGLTRQLQSAAPHVGNTSRLAQLLKRQDGQG